MNVCLGGEYMEKGFPCQENICLSGFLDIPEVKCYGPMVNVRVSARKG